MRKKSTILYHASLKFAIGESFGGEDTVVIHSTPKEDPEGDQAHHYHTKLVKYVPSLCACVLFYED